MQARLLDAITAPLIEQMPQGDTVKVVEVGEGTEWAAKQGRGYGRPERITVGDGQILWQKEAIINRIAREAEKYGIIAWVDGDILFDNPGWMGNLRAALEDCPIAQCWTRAKWLGPFNNPAREFRSVFAGHVPGIQPHPGFAWAARRSLWTHGPGLFADHPTGNGDAFVYHAAAPVFGNNQVSKLSARILHRCSGFESAFRDYRQAMAEWIGSARPACVPGTIRHIWHGPPEGRQYGPRQGILERHGFDPRVHLRTASNGLREWTTEAPAGLVDEVEAYVRRGTSKPWEVAA